MINAMTLLPDLSDLPSVDELVTKAEAAIPEDDTHPPVEIQVELVARMMDEDNPQWFRLIGNNLNMNSTFQCALGQTYHERWLRDGSEALFTSSPYSYGQSRLNAAFDRFELWEDAVSEYGAKPFWYAQANLRRERVGVRPIKNTDS